MPIVSKSVRAGITAMLTVQVFGVTGAEASDEQWGSSGMPTSDILLARSGYIVVAG